MSFRRTRTAILDDSRPIGRRYIELRHAIECYAFLTQTSFESVCWELEARHGAGVAPFTLFRKRLARDPDVISRAFEDVDRARTAFLVRLRAYVRERDAEKRLGVRVPPRAATQRLYASVTLGKPLRWSPAGGGESP